jgi:hypothetical protein
MTVCCPVILLQALCLSLLARKSMLILLLPLELEVIAQLCWVLRRLTTLISLRLLRSSNPSLKRSR